MVLKPLDTDSIVKVTLGGKGDIPAPIEVRLDALTPPVRNDIKTFYNEAQGSRPAVSKEYGARVEVNGVFLFDVFPNEPSNKENRLVNAIMRAAQRGVWHNQP